MSFSEIMNYIAGLLRFQLFMINETPVTIISLVMLISVMLTFQFISRVVIKKILSKVLDNTSFDTGLRYAFIQISHYVVLVIGVIVATQFVGIDLSGLFVIFGFLSVGIGFGLQNLTSNFISGIILLFERPIRVGDRVTVGGVDGDVEEINIRSTTVRSLNNIAIIVPNSEFVSNTVVNWSHSDSKIRLEIDVGVSYNSSLETVCAALMEVALENEEVLNKPAPEVLLMSFGDSAWNMRLRCWISDPRRQPVIISDINCSIVYKFKEKNISIPFPQRELHLVSSGNLLKG